MARQSYRIWFARLTIGAAAVLLIVSVIAFLKRSTSSPAEGPAIDSRTAIDRVNRTVDGTESDAGSPLDPVLQMARDALENMHRNIRDYTAVLEKQERVNGVLKDPAKIELKVMHADPDQELSEEFKLHAYFHFIEPESLRGREVIWVDGENGDKLVAHDTGLRGLIRVSLDPEGLLAMIDNRYPANRVGLENLLRKLIEKGLNNRDVEDVTVDIDEEYKWEGQTVTRIVVTHPQPKPGLDFHRAEILIDRQRQLPLAFWSHLWPLPEGGELPLEEKYIYRDIKLNVGLTKADFDPDNPNYAYP